MAKIKGSAWSTAGVLLVTVAVTAAVAYWIATLSVPGLSLWSWPIWISCLLALMGAGLLIYGMKHDTQSDQPTMRQTGGDNSVNFQSGRDTKINRFDKGK